MSGIIEAIYRKINLGEQSPNKLKGISTLIGAILLHAVIGANQLGNIVTYMTAYLRLYVSKEITYSKDMWFTSVIVLAFTLFTIIGGYMTRKIPMKGVLFLGVITISIGNYLGAAALNHSFMEVVLTLGFMQSAGCGLIYSNVIVISIKWFPKRRGLISGMIIALDSVATMLSMLIQTEYVNPDNIQTVDDYIIDTVVLARVPTYFRIASLIFLVVGAFGCLLTFMPPPGSGVASQAVGGQTETTNYGSFENDRQSLINSDSLSEGTNHLDDTNISGVYQTASHLKDLIENDVLGVLKDEFDRDDEILASSSHVNQELVASSSDDQTQPTAQKKNYYGVRKALRTRMAMILFITFGLSTESSYFISIMAKPYGQFIKDDKFLALIISLGNFANCIGSFVCGRIMDRIKFKHTMLIINCTVAASYFSLIFCQYYQSKLLYAIWIIVINFTSIGFFTSHLPEVMNKFGDKYASTIYGVIHIGPVISALVFSQMLEELIKTFSIPSALSLHQIHYGYYYAFLAIGGLNFLSMIILMIFYRTRTVI